MLSLKIRFINLLNTKYIEFCWNSRKLPKLYKPYIFILYPLAYIAVYGMQVVCYDLNESVYVSSHIAWKLIIEIEQKIGKSSGNFFELLHFMPCFTFNDCLELLTGNFCQEFVSSQKILEILHYSLIIITVLSYS